MAEPKINVDLRWWDLDADPGKLETAATAWRTLGTCGDTTADDLSTAAGKLLDADGKQWKGDTRSTYETHKKTLVTAMTDTKAKADAVASALDGAATILRNRQSDLDTAKKDITGAVSHVIGAHQITFAPEDAKQSTAVMSAVDRAKTIRRDADTQLSPYVSEFSTAKSDWESISTAWKGYVDGKGKSPFTVPPEPRGGPTSITLPDGSVVVNTGDGTENTQVSTGPGGEVVVTVDGKRFSYPAGTHITVRGGSGDDDVTIHPGANADITVLGGQGNDSVADGRPGHDATGGSRTVITGDGDDTVAFHGDHSGMHVSTGGGNDVVQGTGANTVYTGDGDDKVKTTGGSLSGGRGNDEILAGDHDNPLLDGPGHDAQIFGGDGDDKIEGGQGNDTLVGGHGGDQIKAHGGDDVITGGRDYDYLDGGDGNDSISGGAHKDVIYGLDGDDTIRGGSDRDYLEGANGNDVIDGGTSEDVVSGGRGDDRLYGGVDSLTNLGTTDNDVLYGGDGTDHVDGGDGNDKTYIQDGDTTSTETEESHEVTIVDNSFIQVHGSDEYQDRVRADLDMMSSSPNGSAFIESLHHKVDESHQDPWPGDHDIHISEMDGRSNAHKWPLPGADVNINYDPTGSNWRPDMPHGYNERPPIATTYHELAHGWDYLHGTLADGSYDHPDHPDTEDGVRVNNSERAAVGLDYDYTGDGKPDPVRGPDNPHPYQYTENAFSEEMGRDPFPRYGEEKPPTKEWWQFWK
jgi:Ca2+-binding RTX toxin-like protein